MHEPIDPKKLPVKHVAPHGLPPARRVVANMVALFGREFYDAWRRRTIRLAKPADGATDPEK